LSAIKNNYAGLASGAAVKPMGTSIWWEQVVFGKTEIKDERLARTATVMVMSYEETGEL